MDLAQNETPVEVKPEETPVAAETVVYGIENSKKILALACEAANVADKIGHETGASRWANLFNMFDEITGMAGFNFAEFKKEIADYSAQDRLDIIAFLKAKFDLVNDNLEGIIEELVDLIDAQVTVAQKAVSVIAKFKKLS